MTAPREILPERTYLITRRCTQRQFLLRPDARTNAIFDYCIAEAADRHSIDLIAWVAMSNHYHAVVHDRSGHLPAFLEHLNKMLARTLNARWGRWENLWATEQACVTYLATPDTVFEKVVYVLANPIADHLVDRVDDWPGSSSITHLAGKRTHHERPSAFFRKGGVMKTTVELRAKQPPCSAARESIASWARRLRTEVAKIEARTRAERMRKGVRVLGRKAVLRTSAFDSPSTPTPRRGLRPCIACADPDRRVIELRRLRAFRIAYGKARQRYVAGKHRVIFPAGTYRFRRWGARCEDFPAAPPP